MERHECNKGKQSRKLVLNRETLRELTTEEACKVVGQAGYLTGLSRCWTKCTSF